MAVLIPYPNSLFSSSNNFTAPVLAPFTENSFKTWQKLAKHVINRNALGDHLLPHKVPPQFENKTAKATGTESKIYTEWMQKDDFLMTWLYASWMIPPRIGSLIVNLLINFGLRSLNTLSEEEDSIEEANFLQKIQGHNINYVTDLDTL
ncbi:hypothetical protein PIB30_066833 [Stylosanthes scabra]|uniref:Uncharacterized protein n=1 Tax=Stylosanthes scabra TaxID=79078 RepID=A0ABU6WQ99_9FABA|nr:hypothetical protein [Stylosanthes scabra]